MKILASPISGSGADTANIMSVKLKDLGYVYLGCGSDACAFLKGNLVHKYMDARQSGGHQAFVNFIRQDPANPHLVRILDEQEFKIDGRTYLEIVTERLQPLVSSVYSDYWARKVSHELNAPAQKSALRKLGQAKFDRLMNTVTPLDSVCEELYEWGKAHGLTLDLTTGPQGNIMRRNSTPVIMDPFV